MTSPRTHDWTRRRAIFLLTVLAGFVLALAHPATALEIEGVGNAALDQPRINVIIEVDGSFLSVETEDLDGNPVTTYNIEGFYDTGASNSLIGSYHAQLLNLPLQEGATFTDIGVGGTVDFNVSEELTFHLAPYPGDLTRLDNPDEVGNYYNHSFPAMHTAVGESPQTGGDPILDLIAQLLDFNVFGMPMFQDKVVTMNAGGLNQFALTGGNLDVLDDFDNLSLQIETTVHDAATASTNPMVPTGDLHIQTSYADFSDFVVTDPASATGPSMAHNPFIGPNPIVTQLGDTDQPAGEPAPGITVTRNTSAGTSDSTGSWLFDTGAAVSMVSSQIAGDVGVRYRPDHDPESGDPILEDIATGQQIADQFTLTIQGVGGQLTLAGFWLDAMLVPTLEGDPNNLDDPDHLKYLDVPVLVHDIGVTDPSDPTRQIILDGIFGMNLLFGTTYLDGELDIFNLDLALIPGAFEWVTFDQTTGIIGLTTDANIIPEPATLGLMLAAAAPLLLRRRRRP